MGTGVLCFIGEFIFFCFWTSNNSELVKNNKIKPEMLNTASRNVELQNFLYIIMKVSLGITDCYNGFPQCCPRKIGRSATVCFYFSRKPFKKGAFKMQAKTFFLAQNVVTLLHVLFIYCDFKEHRTCDIFSTYTIFFLSFIYIG